MADSLQIAQNMIDAWLKLDWDTVTSLFTDQGSLVIVPARQTYTGAEAIRGHLDEVAGARIAEDAVLVAHLDADLVLRRFDVADGPRAAGPTSRFMRLCLRRWPMRPL